MTEPENFLSRWSRRKLEGEPEQRQAMAEPLRPATNIAANTGPSSRTMEMPSKLMMKMPAP